MVRPAYEARMCFPSTGGVVSSLDMIREGYLHGRELRYRIVPAYKCEQFEGTAYYDFDFIKFNLYQNRVFVEKDENPQEKEVWIGGVKVCSGRYLAGKMFFIDKSQMTHTQLGTIIKSEIPPKKGRDHLWVTYYVSKGSSFGFISNQHIKYLPKTGLNLHTIKMDDLIWKGVSNKDEWGLMHPVFYVFQQFTQLRSMGGQASMGSLKQNHSRLGGFDVADSDRISPYAVGCANQMDLIMVPSKCSRKAYLDSGVECRVEVVPHGVSELYSQIETKLTKLPAYSVRPDTVIPSKGINILFFFLHSAIRKGADIVYKAMKRLLIDRPDVNLILKTGYRSELCNLPRTTYINDWLSETDLVKLYNACHILVAPTRGGGFEVNVLEALARGLVVVTSDLDAIQEYAKRYVLTARSTGKKVQPLVNNPIHTGYGVDPDVWDFHEKLEYAIDNYDSLRKKAERYAPVIREKHNWLDIAKLINKHLQGGK